jgi:hypothetical protein
VGGTALVTAPARAEIVYTPTNVSTTNGSIFVDLNNDGITDFKLYDVCALCTSSGEIKVLLARGAENTLVHMLGRKVNGANPGTAWPVPYGFSIGPNSPKRFIDVRNSLSGPFMASATCFAVPCHGHGPWLEETDKYLGIQFGINGEIHYGWARLTVKTTVGSKTSTIKATLTGYAYETQPNTAILAGVEVAKAESTAGDARGVNAPSLALLSLGSVGLDVWRREKRPAVL